MIRFKHITFLFALALCVSGCSTTSNDIYAGDIKIYDPIEGANRGVFAFNKTVNQNVFHPVLKSYEAFIPVFARQGLTNVLELLNSPITLGNNILQGDATGSVHTLARTAINATVGIAGLIDVAGPAGFEKQQEDFGQTLAVWGVGHGPYFIMPLFGPATLRDGVGRAVDIYFDPVRIYLDNTDRDSLNYTLFGLTYLDLRYQLMPVLDDIYASAIDDYATLRSAYYQNRKRMVNDGKSSQNDEFEIIAFDDDF